MTQNTIISLKCFSPLRIRNRYIGEWLYVPCRKCAACLVNRSNSKALHLSEDIKRVPYCVMVTLTYDNNNVPWVRVGDKRLYRGLDYPPAILCTHELDMSKNGAVLLNAPNNKDAIGVLYYKDLQNFLKRLRVYYERKLNRKFNYKYFAAGEYGTNTKRPHYHVIFYGYEEFGKQFENAVCENWQMCDWSKLDAKQCFRCGGASVASYVASYVTCFANSNGFYNQKWICEKSFRSKDVNHGIDVEEKDRFEKSFRYQFNRLVSEPNINPFEFRQQKRLGSISTCIIPKKYISTYFSSPKGLGASSFSDFLSLHRIVLDGKKVDDVGNSCYLTNLSYRRYCNVRGLKENLSSQLDFVFDSWLYRNMYKSTLIKQSMLEYEQCTDKKDYFRTRINTSVDDLDKRRSRLWFRYRVMPSDYGVDDKDCQKLERYVGDNERKLLPKHLKGLKYEF